MQILQLRSGDLVRIRRRRWRVVDVRTHDACQTLTVVGLGIPGIPGIDDDGLEPCGERRFIAPFDIVEAVEPTSRLRLATRRQWRRACRAIVAGVTPPGGLRAARFAHIDILPHQLEPALAIVRGLGTRLLLADDVGLGKTIQAGLVLSELRARAAVDRVLVLTPAGLRDQWASELSNRFGLTAGVIDARDVRRRLAELPVGVNPWTTIELAVASLDYVKRVEVLPSVRACRWDLLIVDEAHGVTGASDRFSAVASLASRAAYVLLLTATPHNGDDRAFATLCGLGDHGDPLLFFRRTRERVRLGAGRRVRQLHVAPSRAELRMHALVAQFSRVVRDARAGDGAAAWLALTVLNKRALSSARSLERTVARRLEALAAPPGEAHQLVLPMPDRDAETDDTDWAPELTGLSLDDPARERTMLREIAAAAQQAARRETKVAALVRLLGRVTEPVIVFTEYRDTLLHLAGAIARPCAVLHGGLARAERRAALSDFLEGRQSILLATDAAGEGLNLHHRCRIVVNLELPWNPMRLEQRIGRVDRIGQTRTVHAVHLIARDTAETRILHRLRRRIDLAQAAASAPDPLGGVSGESEHSVARLVIDGEEPKIEARRPDHAVVISLEGDAASEAARIVEARRLDPQPQEHTATFALDRPRLMFARGRTRIRLGARVLIVLLAQHEDADGRALEEKLLPLAVAWPDRRFPAADLHAIAELTTAVLATPGAAAGGVLAAWRQSADAAVAAFHGRRLARERAIAALVRRTPDRAFQPGLFDRRLENARLDEEAMELDEDAESARRIGVLHRALRSAAGQPRLVLVLAP